MADTPLMPHKRRYQLSLTFATWVNDDLLTPSPDEDQLDADERLHLKANRAFLAVLLENPTHQYILEELLRKRVLEEAEVMLNDLKGQLLLHNLDDEALVQPVVDGLPVEIQQYFQDASDENTFEEAAGEAIYSVGVELEGAYLGEIEHEDAAPNSIERAGNEEE